MNTCEMTLLKLDDWLDGMLDESDRAAIRAHMAECEACRAAFCAAETLQANLCVLGAAADAIASTPRVQRRHVAISRATLWRIAAALVIAAGGFWAARLTMNAQRTGRGSANDAQRPVQLSPAHQVAALEVETSPRDDVRVSADGDVMAVRIKSSNPRVHIVVLYPTTPAASATPTPPADEKSKANI